MATSPPVFPSTFTMWITGFLNICLLCHTVTGINFPGLRVPLSGPRSSIYSQESCTDVSSSGAISNIISMKVVKHSVTNIRIFEYIRIFSATNIRSYHIRILFLIRIYSDIRSYCFFQYEYIRIFVRIKISYSSHYVTYIYIRYQIIRIISYAWHACIILYHITHA